MAGRVKRSRPKKRFTRYTYGKALPFLLKDFKDRCAYSMLHVREIDVMEVDHFNPHQKSKHVHRYGNLLPSFGSCNRAKGQTWPSKADIAAGIYLIDPTKEVDYGKHIFEDPVTHILKGVTPAGRYHIRILNLNSAYLIERRHIRAEFRKLLTVPAMYTGSWIDQSTGATYTCLKTLREVVERMIPDIDPPPAPVPTGSSPAPTS